MDKVDGRQEHIHTVEKEILRKNQKRKRLERKKPCNRHEEHL